MALFIACHIHTQGLFVTKTKQIGLHVHVRTPLVCMHVCVYGLLASTLQVVLWFGKPRGHVGALSNDLSLIKEQHPYTRHCP